MCELFIGAEKDLWESRTRSFRVQNAVTSVRLENFYWSVLEEIAFRDDMSVGQLMARLQTEALAAGHDIDNFTSFLRVCCGRYKALIAAGDLSDSLHDRVGDVDAEAILSRERERYAETARTVGSASERDRVDV
ncbi:MAG: ribbon-helix-helix domain-containing protein [Actinomycetota bacterium]